MQSSIKKINLNTEYVYCMSNESFCPNIVKVGWTRNNPAHRANQLYTTGVPTPFVVEFMVLTASGHDLERRIHNYLSKCRVSGSREFFNISVSELRSVLTGKFSLTLVQLSDIIDQMPKIDNTRKSNKKNKWISMKNIPLNDTSDETSNEPKSMFDEFRYDGPILLSKISEPKSMFDEFRYNGPTLLSKPSEPTSIFDEFCFREPL